MKLASRIFKKDDWYVTSPFGNRSVINTSGGTTSTFHSGCDYGTYEQKWPQYAIENGSVISCGTENGANYVWVQYPRIGKKLLHYHLDSIKVKTGQEVNQDTLIGYTGMTGKTTGVHLHLGMKTIGSDTYEDPHAYEYNEFKITSPVNRDENINQIQVLVDQLYVRDNPTTGNIYGFATQNGIYNDLGHIDNENYTWIKIADNQYLAYQDSWVKLLPKKVEESKPIELPKEEPVEETPVENPIEDDTSETNENTPNSNEDNSSTNVPIDDETQEKVDNMFARFVQLLIELIKKIFKIKG